MRYEYAVTPGLSVSFQRYPYPAGGLVPGLPTSRGALPVHVAERGRLILPVPADEAFWVGLIADPGGPGFVVRVIVSLESGTALDAVTGAAPAPTGTDASGTGTRHARGEPGVLRVPPQYALPGVAGGSGTWWALARDAHGSDAPASRSLDVLAWPVPMAPHAARPGGPRPQHSAGGASPERSPVPPGPPSFDRPPAAVRIDLVDAPAFEALTGSPMPPPHDRHGGYRLP
jgi:hypothetical protein